MTENSGLTFDEDGNLLISTDEAEVGDGVSAGRRIDEDGRLLVSIGGELGADLDEAIDDKIATNGASGRELAYASSTAVQTGIAGTATDVTNLSITFDVGSRPVYVEVSLPYVTAVTNTAGAIGRITDESNTMTRFSGETIPAAAAMEVRVVERINTPGTYTRKARMIRGSGTGTITINLDSTTVAYIRAMEA